jgi:hypothetical protein
VLLGVVVVVTAPAAPCTDGVVELVDDVNFTVGIALCPTGATVVVGAFTTMSSAGTTVVVAARAMVVVVVEVVVVTAVVVVAAG